MSGPYLLVLDAGSGSGRAVIFDTMGNSVSAKRNLSKFSTALLNIVILAGLALGAGFSDPPTLGNHYRFDEWRFTCAHRCFGLGWGIGGLTFGLGEEKLGLALGFMVIIGLAASAGTLVAMIVLSPEKLAQPQGLMTVVALKHVLAGIGLCSGAGKLREPDHDSPGGSPQQSLVLAS